MERDTALHDVLRHALERKASDVHLKAGAAPFLRVDGQLKRTVFPVLEPGDCERACFEIMSDEQVQAFRERGEADFAYEAPGLGRFRVNVFRQRGSIGMACRQVPPEAPPFETLGLPPVVRSFADHHRGLILVTGPTSSGKTTTTASLIDHINLTRACHILTIEDPIEILHRDRLAIVNQREVGQDTAEFGVALRAAMRQDPDVISIGEIRDAETVKAALQAAETGHLVIATLHTTDVAETINRVIDFFLPHQQTHIRVSLAASLRGVVSQRLLPRKDGGGRVPAVEVLLTNGRVRDLILHPDKTHMIPDIVAQSSFYGMQTFDQALLELYRAGLVELKDAMAAATNGHDFEIMLKQEGLQPIG